MLTTAKYFRRSTTANAWDVETRTFGTPRAAELWATDVLKGQAITTTNECYWRDVGRASSVTVHRAGKQIAEIAPPVYVHQSIGERGY